MPLATGVVVTTPSARLLLAPRTALALAAGILALAVGASAAAGAEEWTARSAVEPESAEEVRAATVTNAAGFTLAIAREPGGERIIGILRLPPADQDLLDDARSLGIRIDDGPRFEPPRAGGGLKSATFFLWDGIGEPAIGPLRDLMEARDHIVMQYPLAGGGHKEIALAAKGAKAAIASVLGVAAEVSAPVRALAIARQEAVERCLADDKPKERDRCLERLAGCAGAATAEEMRGCLGARPSIRTRD
jgi:hypothetical protein